MLVSKVEIGNIGGVEVSANDMWMTMLKYIDDMGLGDVLEEAMLIACALSQNKYYTTVGLPKVISYVDMC